VKWVQNGLSVDRVIWIVVMELVVDLWKISLESAELEQEIVELA